ncbi:MAG: helix-turn-helix domain-containing protein, partial [Bacillota bacterium]|nr:helix-turn-helix domain-containing protein [Bacillota bacterium]
METQNRRNERLVRIMESWGVTRQQLADVLAISVKTLIRKINGRLDWLVTECRRIARFFGTTIAHLFDHRE